MALRNEHQRAVYRHHFVEENRDIHRPRLRHAVVARPGAVILMPLPDIAIEGRFGIELELMDVNVLIEQLPQWLDQPRMLGKEREDVAEGMRCEHGARRAGFLPPDFLPVELEHPLRLVTQQRGFFLAETTGKVNEALLVK